MSVQLFGAPVWTIILAFGGAYAITWVIAARDAARSQQTRGEVD